MFHIGRMSTVDLDEEAITSEEVQTHQSYSASVVRPVSKLHTLSSA